MTERPAYIQSWHDSVMFRYIFKSLPTRLLCRHQLHYTAYIGVINMLTHTSISLFSVIFSKRGEYSVSFYDEALLICPGATLQWRHNGRNSQITSLTIVYSIVYSDADQRKHQSFASLAFVRGIHRGPVNSAHKGPVTRKMFPFDDVIMKYAAGHGRPPCCLDCEHKVIWIIFIIHDSEVTMFSLCIFGVFLLVCHDPWCQGWWDQYGVHLGPTGPRWAPCWSHQPGYLRCLCELFNYERPMLCKQ